MTRPKTTVMILAATLALSVWVVDAWLDSVLFSGQGTWELLIHPPAHKLYLRILLSACFLLFGGFAAFVADRLKQAGKNARQVEDRLRATLDSIDEAVIAMDTGGFIRRMNPKSQELTGWSLAEARNRHITEVLRLYNARTKAPCPDPAQKVLQEGSIQGIANHTLLVSREGEEYHIADSASPIRDEHGCMTGVVMVLRDMSEEYTASLLTRKRLELADYSTLHSLDQMITYAVDEITDLLNSPIGFFHILAEDENELSRQHWSSATLREYCRTPGCTGHAPAQGAGVWADCLREKKPVIHNDYRSLPHARDLPEGHPEMVRQLLVPVLRENRVVAVFGAGNKPTEYTERDREIAAFLADVTWGAFKRRQAEEREYHLTRVLDALRKVNRLITAEKDRSRLIQEACNRLIETRGYHCAWILLLDASGGISLFAEAGISREFPLFLHRLERGEHFYCVHTTLRQAEILVVHDPTVTCPDCPLAVKHTTWATMTIRLEHEKEIYGVLGVSMDRSFAQYAEEWNLFREVAADISFALYSLDLEEEHRHAEEALRESERQLSTLMDNLPGMAYRCRCDPEWTMEFISRGCLELTGYASSDFVENHKRAYADVISDQDRNEVHRIVQEAVRQKSPLEVEYRIMTADGGEKHVWQKGGCVSSGNQDPCLEGFITDITEKKRAEDALRRQEEHLRAILQANPDPLVVYDHQGHPQYINPSFTRVFGWTVDELLGRKVPFVPEDQVDKTLARIQDIFHTGEPVQFDTTRWTKDGRLLDIRVSAALINPAGKENSGLVVNLTDITERKSMEKKLEHMSLYDALTGLYNRAFFEEEMRRLGTRRSSWVAIVVCDVDGLKLINDTLGHSKGDELLRATANTLRSCFRTGDIAARIGGDEFAVLLPDADEGTVRVRCEQIHAEVARSHQLNPELGLSVSVGFAASKDPNEGMRALFKRADDAMYKQKLQQSRNSRNETVQALITTMEARDRVTEGHAGRLEDFALQMGRSLGLPGERMNDLRLLARFHDLGKVGVPDCILFKPGPLTQEEFEEMKRHCEIGHRIALSTSYLGPIADFILKHHEWWDGRGYPLGLSGEEIPLECRILAVVDAYDTMTNERPYKGAMPQQEAIRELWHYAGAQFEPELVELFTRIVQEGGDEESGK